MPEGVHIERLVIRLEQYLEALHRMHFNFEVAVLGLTLVDASSAHLPFGPVAATASWPISRVVRGVCL